MRYLLWTIVILAALLIQGTITVLGVSPNITVLLTYYLGIRHGEIKGMFSGMALGLVEDSLALSIIGPHMLSKGVVGFLSSRLVSGGFLRWTSVLGLLTVCAFTAIDNFTVFLSRAVFDKSPAQFSGIIYITIMQALLNAPAGMLIKPRHAD